MSAKTELSAVEKDGIAALNELKSTDKLVSESLKAELDRVREEVKFVTMEREAQKTQLIDALLTKDKLRKEMEEMKELQETAVSNAASQDASEATKKANEKIEKLRDRLIERKQVSHCFCFSCGICSLDARAYEQSEKERVWNPSWEGYMLISTLHCTSNLSKQNKISSICSESSRRLLVGICWQCKRYVSLSRLDLASRQYNFIYVEVSLLNPSIGC